MRKARTVVDTNKTPYGPRELMLGIEYKGKARAYVLDTVLKQKLIQDTIGGTPIIIVTGPERSQCESLKPPLRAWTKPRSFTAMPPPIVEDRT